MIYIYWTPKEIYQSKIKISENLKNVFKTFNQCKKKPVHMQQ